MKDGSTHLAHKAEHAVDMDTGAVVAVTLQEADLGDTTTVRETLAEAGTAVAELIEREASTRPAEDPQVNLGGVEEVVADKGYHSGPVLREMQAAGVRTYIPEKKQAGKRHWVGKDEEREVVYANRQRLQRALVVAQIAVSVMLLTGAGLLTRTMLELSQVETGLTTESVLTMEVPVSTTGRSDADTKALYERMRYEVAAVFHGHAHRGSLEGRTTAGAPVYNVAMPLLKKAFPDRPPVRFVEIAPPSDPDRERRSGVPTRRAEDRT